jgi:hypothetical protein
MAATATNTQLRMASLPSPIQPNHDVHPMGQLPGLEHVIEDESPTYLDSPIDQNNFEIGRILHLRSQIQKYRIGPRTSHSPIGCF